jgi:Cys-rich repeat protein
VVRPSRTNVSDAFRTRQSGPAARFGVIIACFGVGASAIASACNGAFRFDEPAGDAAADASVDGSALAPGKCESESDCRLASLHCDKPTGTCVECDRDAQCGPTAPHCDPVLHRCVACEGNLDCASPATCDAPTRSCIMPCRDGQEKCPAGLRCNEVALRCVQCFENENCRTGARRTCELKTGRCVECLRDSDCPGARCDTFAGVCTECLSTDDCPAERPLCDFVNRSCQALP